MKRCGARAGLRATALIQARYPALIETARSHDPSRMPGTAAAAALRASVHLTPRAAARPGPARPEAECGLRRVRERLPAGPTAASVPSRSPGAIFPQRTVEMPAQRIQQPERA